MERIPCRILHSDHHETGPCTYPIEIHLEPQEATIVGTSGVLDSYQWLHEVDLRRINQYSVTISRLANDRIHIALEAEYKSGSSCVLAVFDLAKCTWCGIPAEGDSSECTSKPTDRPVFTRYIGSHSVCVLPRWPRLVRFAHRVNTPELLDSVLDDRAVDMLEADVVYDVLTSTAIMGHDLPDIAHPSEPAFTLQQFLRRLRDSYDTGPIRGIKLDLKMAAAMEPTVKHITEFIESIPLDLLDRFPRAWFPADALHSPGAAAAELIDHAIQPAEQDHKTVPLTQVPLLMLNADIVPGPGHDVVPPFIATAGCGSSVQALARQFVEEVAACGRAISAMVHAKLCKRQHSAASSDYGMVQVWSRPVIASVGWSTDALRCRYSQQHVDAMQAALSGIEVPVTFAIQAAAVAESMPALRQLILHPMRTFTFWCNHALPQQEVNDLYSRQHVARPKGDNSDTIDGSLHESDSLSHMAFFDIKPPA